MALLTPKRFWLVIAALLLIFLAVLCTAPLAGSVSVHIGEAFSRSVPYAENTHAQILFGLRLPRILMAAVAGATLALAGLVFQALLRNSLATPYTLGVSGGSALGAVIVIKAGWTAGWLGFSAVSAGAFAGALSAVALVYGLARLRHAVLSSYTLILAGVSVSFFFSAVILFIHYLADFTETYQMVRWIMGGVDLTRYGPLLRLAPLCLAGFTYIVIHSRSLNLISLGMESALSRGVEVHRIQRRLFLITSMLTGLVVAHTGPIGFVGLMVPHFLRLMLGHDHRLLVPASVLAGASFLILADTLARTVIAPAEIPVGVMTALGGGPFFLWLIFRKKSITET